MLWNNISFGIQMEIVQGVFECTGTWDTQRNISVGHIHLTLLTVSCKSVKIQGPQSSGVVKLL